MKLILTVVADNTIDYKLKNAHRHTHMYMHLSSLQSYYHNADNCQLSLLMFSQQHQEHVYVTAPREYDKRLGYRGVLCIRGTINWRLSNTYAVGQMHQLRHSCTAVTLKLKLACQKSSVSLNQQLLQ